MPNARLLRRRPRHVAALDALKPSSSTLFTVVGYGVQRINPATKVAEKIRTVATGGVFRLDRADVLAFVQYLK